MGIIMNVFIVNVIKLNIISIWDKVESIGGYIVFVKRLEMGFFFRVRKLSIEKCFVCWFISVYFC